MRYALDKIPICEPCEISQGKEITTKFCERCKTEFCPHYASEVDFHFCGNCMDDINLDVQIYKQRDCKSFKLGGSDFYFAEQTIHQMSDRMIDIKIEYFSAMLSGLMLERQERKIERQARLSKVKLNFVRPATADNTGALKEKRSRTPKAIDKQAAIVAALTTMLGRVPSVSEIDAFTKLAGSK